MEQQPTVKIIASSSAGDLVVAAGGRISTTQGTALEIYERTKTRDNNASLIEKVVSSGHTSVLEHQFFSVAFDSVSVFTEQFVIEFRLGSYTVQSRRYVDYSKTGFYTPPLPDALTGEFTSHMQSLFDDYAKLLTMGIPKEDARFLLPYCFRSNFLCTMNARELIYMVNVMTAGRGRFYPELRMLGESLKEQLRAYFPHVPDILAQKFKPESRQPDRFKPYEKFPKVCNLHEEHAETELESVSPANPLAAIEQALEANWMVNPDPDAPFAPEDAIFGERPRELELIHVQFSIYNLSLAAITHLVRHRVQTVLVPHIAQAVLMNAYLVPDSVKADPLALSVYQSAFQRNARTVRSMIAAGLPGEAVQYFALAGNQLDVSCAMNGRELLHFMKLRTCNRAQWEIRACAVSLLKQLRAQCPEVFGHFGPSCYVTGSCPEGKLSCGKAAEIKKQFS
ncbi:MAG: FAD-dependent thymidylate synthase [Oscillospiraceae bacterium]|nr:FAD-dependent thymidylate synthase [Oscillospiraceae bacterium]